MGGGTEGARVLDCNVAQERHRLDSEACTELNRSVVLAFDDALIRDACAHVDVDSHRVGGAGGCDTKALSASPAR